MSKQIPRTSTLSAIAGIYILTQVIIVPALPNLQEVFSSDYKTVQLSISVFLLGAAIVNLVAGPLSDRFGRRPIALSFFIVFILASVGCFFSTNIYIFLMFRFLQSTSAAGMVLARAIVGDIYSPKQSTVMFGYISVIMALGPLLGPFLGGLVTEIWGSIYIFNLLSLLGITILLLIFFDLRETNSCQSSSIFAQAKNYSQLLKSPKFWVPTFVSSWSFAVFGVFFVGGPFVASNTFELSPTLTGIFFSCPALGFILGNMFVSSLANKISTTHFLVFGAVSLTLGPLMSLILANLYFNPASFFLPIIIMTFGAGIIWPTSNTEIVKAVPSLAGSASGLSSALMVLISAFTSGVTGMIIESLNAIFIVTFVLIVIGIITILGSLFFKPESI